MSTDLTKNEDRALAATPDYSEYEGQTGFENQTRDDRSTPYLTLLQTNSPQCDDEEEGNVEGAMPGMFLNSATEELYDGRGDGVIVVPAYTEHLFIEYKPRESGGGFVGTHEVDSDVVRKARSEAIAFNKLKVGENDLTEAFYLYAVLCDGDEPVSGIVIPFTSTKIKTYKKWNTRVSTLLVAKADGRRGTPPIFAHLVRVKSLKQENQHGKFFIFDLTPANGTVLESLLPPNDVRMQAGLELMKTVAAGEAKAAQPVADTGDGTNSDNVPF
jgi:hypothetical protein